MMPLQNRVDPFGELQATTARGTMFGNRGGKFHRDDRTLGQRRHASRQWICCVLSFKGRQRDVWGRYYTELFFLDEVTALAAGHRPCFECRRADAIAFAERFRASAFSSEVATGSRQENAFLQKRDGTRPSAPAMDDILQAERMNPVTRRKRTYSAELNDLPDGAMVALGSEGAAAIRCGALLLWTPSGYGRPQPRPKNGTADLLTPPSIVGALRRGYQPLWHPSAIDSAAVICR